MLLVENAAIDQIPPLFGLPPAGHMKTELAPRLASINLNVDDNFRDYIVKHLGQKRLFDRVISHQVVQSFIAMIPGLGQLMILGRLFYECELAPEPRYDVVIFDAPASGHFLSLMTTPEAVLSSNLGGPIKRETERVRDFLSDRKKCGMVYVTTPEDLVVTEALDFLPRLEKAAPTALLGLLVNKIPPWSLESLESAEGTGAAAAFLIDHAQTAQRAFRDLKSGLAALGPKWDHRPIGEILDRGVIAEPLAPGFGQMLWRDAARQIWGEAP